MPELKSLPSGENNLYGTVYQAVIFDLDGTLYNQKKLRLMMATRLGLYYLVHPHRIKELLMLKKFREVREHWDGIAETEGLHNSEEDLDALQYEYTAQKLKTSADYVERVVIRWIYDNPLSALPKCKRTDTLKLMQDLKDKGIAVLVLSDYPIEQKLKALSAEADRFYSVEEDERLNELKPSPQGIQLILQDYHLEPSQVLMVGDRDVKDGGAARSAGVDYVIV